MKSRGGDGLSGGFCEVRGGSRGGVRVSLEVIGGQERSGRSK